MAVVSVLNSGTSKSPDVMHLLRLLTLEVCCHNFVFSAAHTPGRDNSAADALSRLRLQESAAWLLTLIRSPVQFRHHCSRSWYLLLAPPVFWSLGSGLGSIHSSCLRCWAAGLLPILLQFFPAVLSVITMAADVICDLVGPDHRYRRHRSPTRRNQRSKLKNPRWRLKRAKSSSDLSNLGKYGRFLALIVGNRQQICPLFWFY